MVPPLSVIPTWSGIRSMTGYLPSGANSPDWAPVRPQTWRANSTTAICIPRQMPRKGTLFSRAYRMAAIFPSTPRLPKPPGTRTPAQPVSSSPALASVTVSLSTHRMSTFTSFSIPPWVRASATER